MVPLCPLKIYMLGSSSLNGHLFGGVCSKRFCKSSQYCSTSASSVLLVGAQTSITVILNGLPWKRTQIILSFLRLHTSTEFQTVLLTMMATPFLLRDSCPQQQIQWSSELNSLVPVHFSLLPHSSSQCRALGTWSQQILVTMRMVTFLLSGSLLSQTIYSPFSTCATVYIKPQFRNS